MQKAVEGRTKVTCRSAAQDVEMEALPSPKVRTLDNKQPKEGALLYMMHAPEELTEYEVISDMAFRDPATKEWHLVVIGPTMPVISHPVSNFTTSEKDWLQFWSTRHKGRRPEVIHAD